MSDFYARAHDVALAVTALTGTSAFAALLPADSPHTSAFTLTLAKLLTAMVAAATTADLVFNPAKKADTYERLHRRFVELNAEMAATIPDETKLQEFTVQRLKIEADEPPVRRLIDIRSQNDECRSRGVPFKDLEPLGFLQRSPLAYFFDFNIHAIEKRKLNSERKLEQRKK